MANSGGSLTESAKERYCWRFAAALAFLWLMTKFLSWEMAGGSFVTRWARPKSRNGCAAAEEVSISAAFRAAITLNRVGFPSNWFWSAANERTDRSATRTKSTDNFGNRFQFISSGAKRTLRPQPRT